MGRIAVGDSLVDLFSGWIWIWIIKNTLKLSVGLFTTYAIFRNRSKASLNIYPP